MRPNSKSTTMLSCWTNTFCMTCSAEYLLKNATDRLAEVQVNSRLLRASNILSRDHIIQRCSKRGCSELEVLCELAECCVWERRCFWDPQTTLLNVPKNLWVFVKSLPQKLRIFERYAQIQILNLELFLQGFNHTISIVTTRFFVTFPLSICLTRNNCDTS